MFNLSTNPTKVSPNNPLEPSHHFHPITLLTCWLLMLCSPTSMQQKTMKQKWTTYSKSKLQTFFLKASNTNLLNWKPNLVKKPRCLAFLLVRYLSPPFTKRLLLSPQQIMHHQTKEIQETPLHHRHLIWALAFHEKQHSKFHNLQTTKTQKNSKDIKKQNVGPLKWLITNCPLSWCFLLVHPSS